MQMYFLRKGAIVGMLVVLLGLNVLWRGTGVEALSLKSKYMSK